MGAQVGGNAFSAAPMQRVNEQQDAQCTAGFGLGHSIGLLGLVASMMPAAPILGASTVFNAAFSAKLATAMAAMMR
ncbi:hypothetical protein G6F57_023538 [Rhizopus arrhizus]|uniref:Uncharacterized protein n=1 Tax=Rhizopus oryzae TaxID=64495 RepID=A0A9P7BIU0_RHIOR|nr:hypothetical protein G6F64_015453 [Rhizopus arrhizus]KAG1422665.1 hypothetical protein G6F57_023538 [Rhizopus arrhizus]